MTSIFLWAIFAIYGLQAAPISKRMVDMTYTFDDTTLHWPGNKEFNLDIIFNGTFTEGIWAQAEEYSSSTHLGTHMDAPAHFTKGGMTIEHIPISSFIAPASVVDITARAELDPDTEVTTQDLLTWESTTGQSLSGTVLLLRTGWGRKWNNQTAFYGTPENDAMKLHFPGMSLEGAQWLVAERNIVGIGTDTLSFDTGIAHDFPVHRLLLPLGIYGLENVANMDQIPIYGATLYVMPMKIGKGSGAPTRVIATFPDVIFS